MRVLVAGCAGFIGYHFCDRLLNDRHEVVGVDNISTGSNRNANDLSARPGFRFVQADIVQPLPVEGRFDWVCNLACPASPVDFGPKSLDILAVCSRGTWNLLDFARAQQARFLQTSTSEVYGDPLVNPQPESYWGNVNPIGPRSCYDEGKRFAEALIVAYVAQHNVQVRVARIFNTYGPRMRKDDGRALPNFISQALANEPLTVHGDGSQTRSFCYVTDQVDGLIRLAGSDVTGPVNIGNPVEITMKAFAEEVIKLAGSRSKIRFTERPKDDPHVRRPDITRATTLLGWKPTVDRAQGLKTTIEWFRSST